MRIRDLLTQLDLPLSASPRLDLELLLAKVLGCERVLLYAQDDYVLSDQQQADFEALYQQRRQGRPMAYILGQQEFWSRSFRVDERVLVPRPETELLVEQILATLPQQAGLAVADLGTGSGVIALTLAAERTMWSLTATDLSQEALQVAQMNAQALALKNVEFCRGAWCNALGERKMDLIVSNPPYIAQEDPCLTALGFEPKLALAAGVDGLAALREIIATAKDHLVEGGWLFLEHGYDQSPEVVALLQANGYQEVQVYSDLAQIKRAVSARR